MLKVIFSSQLLSELNRSEVSPAFASTNVPRALLGWLAFWDAGQEFNWLKLPTVIDVNRYLKFEIRKVKIAADLGIGLSTVYKIHERGRNRRKRNFLG